MAVFSALTALVSSVAGAATGATAAASTAAAAGGAAGAANIAGAVSAISGIAGTAMNFMGAQKAAAGQEKAERIRQVQMNLEADRERRGVVRQAIVARANALSSATAQGAADGSGAQAGMGNIVSSAGDNIGAINAGQQLGNAMFAANRQVSRGQTMMSIGGAIQGIGNNIAQGFETYSRVFNPRVA